MKKDVLKYVSVMFIGFPYGAITSFVTLRCLLPAVQSPRVSRSIVSVEEVGKTPPKVSGCRGADSRASARPMSPGPLAPLDSHKTRALTTIYAPRKRKPRVNKTAQNRMLENKLPVNRTVSPFHPLPAIGKKIKEQTKTKVIVFDLNKSDTIENQALKLQEVLKPLTPLSIHGYRRKNSVECLERKPHRLLRENTYDVIEPLYLNATNIKQKNGGEERVKMSPKTRFKNAALQVVKLTSMPETGKLLSMRERETFAFCPEEEKSCRLQQLPQSPAQNLNKLSEIFQRLDMKGRHRRKMIKDNSWF